MRVYRTSVMCIRLQVKKFYGMMGVEPDKLRLHLDVWGIKKLFSNAVRRWGVSIGNRRVPRASPEHIFLGSKLLVILFPVLQCC